MDEQALEKSISQMRGMFVFFGGIFAVGGALMFLVLLGGGGNGRGADSDTNFVSLFILAVPFLLAFWGLGKRNKIGYRAAQVSSVLFLIGFPVLTYFGFRYLQKLADPAMKRLFGLGG